MMNDFVKNKQTIHLNLNVTEVTKIAAKIAIKILRFDGRTNVEWLQESSAQ